MAKHGDMGNYLAWIRANVNTVKGASACDILRAATTIEFIMEF